MCTFKAGMLEHSVMGPQIPLGKRMYVCVLLHDMSCASMGCTVMRAGILQNLKFSE